MLRTSLLSLAAISTAALGFLAVTWNMPDFALTERAIEALHEPDRSICRRQLSAQNAWLDVLSKQQRCSDDSECMLAPADCKLGCYTPVSRYNAEVVASYREDLRIQAASCPYCQVSCPAVAVMVRCVQRRCVTVTAGEDVLIRRARGE